MIQLNQIASLAKTFLPKNSPWIQKIEQAQNLASQFSHSPDGVRDLMQHLGKSQEDVSRAISALNNPFISSMINRISPNLSDRLKEYGGKLINEPSSLPISSGFENQLSIGSPNNTGNFGTTKNLRERLNQL